MFVEMFIDILNFLNYKGKHRLYTKPMACAQKYQAKKGQLNFKANGFEILRFNRPWALPTGMSGK